jgi:hypothetical protein
MASTRVLQAGRGVSVALPASAVPSGVDVKATVVDSAPAPTPSGLTVAGPILLVTPHGTSFSAPVTIKIPASTRGGSVYTLADDADRTWEPVSGIKRDANGFTFDVTHISYFAELASSTDGDASPSPGDAMGAIDGTNGSDAAPGSCGLAPVTAKVVFETLAPASAGFSAT